MRTVSTILSNHIFVIKTYITMVCPEEKVFFFNLHCTPFTKVLQIILALLIVKELLKSLTETKIYQITRPILKHSILFPLVLHIIGVRNARELTIAETKIHKQVTMSKD